MNKVLKIFIILIFALTTFGQLNRVYAANEINQKTSYEYNKFMTAFDVEETRHKAFRFNYCKTARNKVLSW